MKLNLTNPKTTYCVNYFYCWICLLVFCALFVGCDDAELMVSSALENSEAVFESRYTGVLYRVGTLEKFGLNAEDPEALEWNGTDLSMIAEHGSYPYEGYYLFRVSRETGKATKVNAGARDFGGTFAQGRTFTQVHNVRPVDLSWNPVEKQMYAICPVLDVVVSIDVETGLAGRVTWKEYFCLLDENGNRLLGAGVALAWHQNELFMVGKSLYGTLDGRPPLAQLFLTESPFFCAVALTENPPIQFGVGEDVPTTLCSDGRFLYMTGLGTQGLYIMDTYTGHAFFVAKWTFAEIPPGHKISTIEGRYVNISRNVESEIRITGLAFDGESMWAVDRFTDALYRVGTE